METVPPASRRRVHVAVLMGAMLAVATPAAALPPVNTQRAAAPEVPRASVVQARAALAAAIGPGALVETDPRLGALRWVADLNGTLTGPSADPPPRIALDYLEAHRHAFGLTADDLDLLRFRRDYVDILGTHHLAWVQRRNGIKIFGAGLQASVASDGSLVEIAGPVYHVGRVASAGRPRVSAARAIAVARRGTGPGRRGAGIPDRASRVLFPSGGSTRLAWQTITAISPVEVDRSVIDARTGVLLWRDNLAASDQSGTGLAWPNAPGPFPNGGGDAVTVTFPVKDATALSGNNAHVYSSTRADDRIDPADEIPASDPGTLTWHYPATLDTSTGTQNCSAPYPCTWNLADPFSWQTNRAQESVQAYALLNRYHDHLEAPPIGFTEAAGNFQVTNDDGEGGVAGDPVLAETLLGANLFGDGRPAFYNNASMYTPADGTSPHLSLLLFRRDPDDPTFPSADGADDASVVFHEYTHGLSSRLVTMPDGSHALYGDQAGAMGEGWSDWYALDALVADGYQTDTNAVDLPVAPWVTGGVGIRFQDADCRVTSNANVCPPPTGTAGSGGFTYGDFGRVDTGPEVHADGEIWLQTLWQLRGAIGRPATETLVTRAMELSPQAPSFLDMRNAILLADTIAYGGAHHSAIWHAFASRGMGFFASTRGSYDESPREDTSLPVSCPGDPDCGTFTGRVLDPSSNAPVAGAVVRIAGPQSAVPVDLSATTDVNGTFAIEGVPLGTYRDVEVSKPGYRTHVLHDVEVSAGLPGPVMLVRDWASLDGGATLLAATGPDHTTVGGCGPRSAVDGSTATSWLTSLARAQSLTIRLPRSIHVEGFGVDPTARCAGRDANTKGFDIYTRRPHAPWVLAFRAARQLPADRVTALAPRAGVWGVRFVRLVLRSAARSHTQVDFTELVVRGVG
jgi:extracellular elastinolytic metalloproteinase